MKKMILVLTVLILSIAFFGCDNGTGGRDSIAAELIGNWVSQDEPSRFTVQFSKNDITFGGSDNFGDDFVEAIASGAKWRASNGKIEIGAGSNYNTIFTYTLSGSILTLTYSHGGGDEILVKQ